jgi:hypothetical protein
VITKAHCASCDPEQVIGALATSHSVPGSMIGLTLEQAVGEGEGGAAEVGITDELGGGGGILDETTTEVGTGLLGTTTLEAVMVGAGQFEMCGDTVGLTIVCVMSCLHNES